MRLASSASLLAAVAALGSACGGRVANDDRANGPADAAEEDATIDAVVDANAGEDAAGGFVDTMPTPAAACGCCGAPFAQLVADAPSALVSTTAGDLLLAGNTDVGTSLGRLWLARIGDGGVTIWKRTYDGQGVLTSLLETPGGFVLLRSGGGGNLGAQVVATDTEGALLWSKKIDPGVTEFVSNGIGVTTKGIVVPAAYSRPGSWGTWIGRLDINGNLRSATTETDRYVTAVGSSRRGGVAICGSGASGEETICSVDAPDETPIWRRTVALPWVSHVALAEDGSLYGVTSDGVRPHLVKLDANGDVLWDTTLGTRNATETSVASLVATPDSGFALMGYVVDATLSRTLPSVRWYWYVVRGDASGGIRWAKAYAPAGQNGGQGRAIAACSDGVVMTGSSWASGTGTSWLVRTDASGGAPITAPGKIIDL